MKLPWRNWLSSLNDGCRCYRWRGSHASGLCRKHLGVASGSHGGQPYQASSKRNLSEGHPIWSFCCPARFVNLCYNAIPVIAGSKLFALKWEVAVYFSSINPLVSPAVEIHLNFTDQVWAWSVKSLVLFSDTAFSTCLLPLVMGQKERKMTPFFLLANDQSIVWRPFLYPKENNDQPINLCFSFLLY